MPRRVFIFDGPDRFVPGSVGEPGDRRFFLQARKGGALVTLGVEKAQVMALAKRLDDLLDAVEAPPADPSSSGDALEEPVVELFRVGTMALAWDPQREAVLFEAQTETEEGDYVEVDDDATEGPDLLRVRLPPEQARSFVRRAQAIVAAGRPPCPFCGEPLDPQGHFCTRADDQIH